MRRMKQLVIVAFVIGCISALTFTNVSAMGGSFYKKTEVPTITWADPYVPETSVQYSSSVLGVETLPGTEVLDSGKILPAGFNHEMQFGGKGLEISGRAAGKSVEACFDFPTYRYSWNGVIKQWNGTKWVALPTTITPTADGSTATACTPKVSNGTYSLLIWYYGPIEPVVTEKPV
jgi:hypothetical protein